MFSLGGARIAFSTDTFVVRPLFFPGGSIGHLAVNGTVNDLAMSGAVPSHLSCGFVLEEGTDLSIVGRVAQDMGTAARAAGVAVVTGDTKVVDAGHGDQVYVNTAGVGLVPDGVDIRPQRAEPGDVVIVSGDIGVHGIAIMSVREGLEFGTEIVTDSAALHPLVAAMLAVTNDLHALRDPTRGGLATSLNEIAAAAGVGVRLVEKAIPVPADVGNACALLGLDPLYVANEGKLVAFVPTSACRCRAGGDGRAPPRQGCGRHRRVRRRAPRHGGREDHVRRHPRRRHTTGGAATAHLLTGRTSGSSARRAHCRREVAMFIRVAVLALIAGAIGAAVLGLPDLKRYIRIRSM